MTLVVQFLVWTVALVFAATLILTLCGLVGKVQIKDGYLKVLVTMGIIEVLTLAIFIVRSSFTEFGFNPSIEGTKVYLFNEQGEPLPPTVLKLGGEVKQTFNEEPPAFQVRRTTVLDNDQLQVTSQSGATLGTLGIRDLSEKYSDPLTSPSKHLDLGLHYAEEVEQDGKSGRRDGPNAVKHLLRVLRSSHENTSDHKDASVQLFYLKEKLTTCQDFELLAKVMAEHQDAPAHFKELGDVYFAMATHLRNQDAGSVGWARQESLRNYLLFLAAANTAVDNDAMAQTRSNSELLRNILFQPSEEPYRRIQEGGQANLLHVADSLRADSSCVVASASLDHERTD